MNQAQFLIEHKTAITALKKQALKKAAWVFVGVTGLLVWVFGYAFWVFLFFPIVAAFITYARLHQLYLHRRFPEHFEPPQSTKPHKSHFLNTMHPLNPVSLTYWNRSRP